MQPWSSLRVLVGCGTLGWPTTSPSTRTCFIAHVTFSLDRIRNETSPLEDITSTSLKQGRAHHFETYGGMTSVKRRFISRGGGRIAMIQWLEMYASYSLLL